MRSFLAYLPVALGIFCAAALTSCAERTGDAPTEAGAPQVTGNGLRIRQVTDPSIQGRPATDSIVAVTGATVVAIDTFDETQNGRSRGTIYVQDVGSQEPYSGIGLFAPAFIPGDLRVGPGDVLDLTGQYQENKAIGTAIFPEGQVLAQLARPVATFRYEFRAPEPRLIDAQDLADYNVGRRWVGMLVTLKDVRIQNDCKPDKNFRVQCPITKPDPNVRNPGVIVNELFDYRGDSKDTVYKQVTGVVTYFFGLHVAPRSAADLVK
jgi:hypothetical protein